MPNKAKQGGLRRFNVILVTVVFTSLLAGFVVERAKHSDPFGRVFTKPGEVGLEPLEVPTYEHRLRGLSEPVSILSPIDAGS